MNSHVHIRKTILDNFIIGWFVSPHHLSKHTDKLLLHFPTSYLILPTLLKLGSRNFYLDLEISEKASLYFPSHGVSSTFFFFFSFPIFLLFSRSNSSWETEIHKFVPPLFPSGIPRTPFRQTFASTKWKAYFCNARSNSVQRRKEVLSPCRWRVCVHAFTDIVSELLWKVERILTVNEEFPFNCPLLGWVKVLIKFWTRKFREFLWN